MSSTVGEFGSGGGVVIVATPPGHDRRMDERRLAIAAVAAANDGLFTRGDWISHGLTARQLQYALRVGAIERLGTRSFCHPGQPRTFELRLRSGLADLGQGALIGGTSAGRVLGLDGFRGLNDVEFSVDRSHRSRRTDALVRSHSPLLNVDRCEVNGLPCLSATRLVLEECGRWTTSQLESAVDSSLRLGWSSETFLRSRLRALRGPGKRGVRVLDSVLDGGGGHSWLEREFLQLLRRARIEPPVTQRTFRTADRTIARVDAVWPARRLIVEVAGHATHSTRRQRQIDAQRQTELSLLGYVVLTFTYEDVVERPQWVATMISTALARGAAVPRSIAG